MSRTNRHVLVVTIVSAGLLFCPSCSGPAQPQRAAVEPQPTASEPPQSAPTPAPEATGAVSGDLEVARADVEANPTAGGYVNLSLLYYRAERFRESIEACQKALEINPSYAIAHNNICSAHVELGEYDAAIAACEKALGINPDFERAKNNLAWAQKRGQ